jgi:hypothetical protein
MKKISYILISLIVLLFLYGAWDYDSCMKGLIHREGFKNDDRNDHDDYTKQIKENMDQLNSESITNQKKLKKLLNSSNSNKEMNDKAKAILNS